jgi:hypothetical protein
MKAFAGFIWAPKGMQGRSCCKIPYKGYEISIAMDDSCGALDTYSRSDIRVYRESDDVDVTHLFTDSMLYGDAETLKSVFATIDGMESVS